MAAAVVLLAAVSAEAQLYRWTDPSGRVHFTDTPPPSNARNVQKKRLPAPAKKAAPSEPFSVQQARKTSPVTLYTGPNCDACAQARKLLNERGVPFKEVSVVDEAGAAQLKKAAGGGGIVPAIVVGASSQMGFDQDSYQGMLDAAGYPKPGILPPKNPPPAPGSGAPGAPPAAPPAGR